MPEDVDRTPEEDVTHGPVTGLPLATAASPRLSPWVGVIAKHLTVRASTWADTSATVSAPTKTMSLISGSSPGNQTSMTLPRTAATMPSTGVADAWVDSCTPRVFT